MRNTFKLSWVAVTAILLTVTAVSAKERSVDERRAAIDDAAASALTELFGEYMGAEDLYQNAYGYAVFSNHKAALLVSGGVGVGVAVDKASGGKTYMKMGTGGVGLGVGYKKYRVVFLFESKAMFDKFVASGWSAETQAGAAAGTEGASVGASFHEGVAIYQLTKKGLMANADVSGTKFWKNQALN